MQFEQSPSQSLKIMPETQDQWALDLVLCESDIAARLAG